MVYSIQQEREHPNSKINLFSKALFFLKLVYNELGEEHLLKDRIIAVRQQISETGTYKHLYKELETGARLAWRQNGPSEANPHWKQLQVLDRRDLEDEKDVFEAIKSHLQFSTNNGKVRPVISIFPAQDDPYGGFKIWNKELISYAGFSIMGKKHGNQHNRDFTYECLSLGWTTSISNFEILPIVISQGNKAPKLFKLSKEYLREVPLKNEKFKAFEELKLRWYALTSLGNLKLELGGIVYSSAPFSSWHMGPEIISEQLLSEDQFNFRDKLIQDESQMRSHFARQRAMIDMNEAILDAFEAQGCKIQQVIPFGVGDGLPTTPSHVRQKTRNEVLWKVSAQAVGERKTKGDYSEFSIKSNGIANRLAENFGNNQWLKKLNSFHATAS